MIIFGVKHSKCKICTSAIALLALVQVQLPIYRQLHLAPCTGCWCLFLMKGIQKLIQLGAGISFLALSKKKRPEGLFQLAVTPIIVIFINSRRNEIEIILFPAGIAESFFAVWEIDNPIGFVDFLIAFWANRREFCKHDFRVTGVRCMAHNASSGVKLETSAVT